MPSPVGGDRVKQTAEAEHIGLEYTGDNISAKRVANYIWDPALGDAGEWKRDEGGGGSSSGGGGPIEDGVSSSTKATVRDSTADGTKYGLVALNPDGTNIGTASITGVNALTATATSLNGAAYSATTSITNDYLLSRASFKFSTNLSRTITITDSIGTVLYSETSTALSIPIDFNDIVYKSGENITVAVTATSGACTLTYVLAIKQGSTNPVSGSTVSVTGTVATQEAVPTTIVAFRTTITTAGTRVQLASNSCSAVVIEAPSTNTGVIYVGDSSVSSTVFGAELQPGQSTGLAINNTNKIYVDTATSGNKVAVLGS